MKLAAVGFSGVAGPVPIVSPGATYPNAWPPPGATTFEPGRSPNSPPPDWSDAALAVGANTPSGNPAGTVTTTGIVTPAPDGMVPSEQVNVAGPAVQVPWLGLLDTTVEPAGKSAVNETLVWSTSESLATVKVCCTRWPAVTVSGELTSVTPMSPDGGGVTAKLALTDASADIVTLQAPVPEHAPPQPVNVLPSFGVAVNATDAPSPNVALQVVGHAIPDGSEATEPSPVTLTSSVRVTATAEKLAPTDWSPVIVTLQAPLPEQAPVQPSNTNPSPGAGVSPTVEPSSNAAAHVSGHEIPDGSDATEPSPVTFTVKVCVTGSTAVQSLVAEATASHGPRLSAL